MSAGGLLGAMCDAHAGAVATPHTAPMSRYETRSSQFGLVSGIRQPASDMVLVAEASGLFAPETRKGRLYIVAETDHDVARGRDACQLICRTIRKHFYDDTSFSVTASLRKALLAANRALYQQNFGVPVQKRSFVGVSCAVVKGDDVYLAQVKPAQSYLLAEGKLRALPGGPSWRQSQEQQTAVYFKPNALGNSLTVEPEFFRATLRPGDGLLLCTSNLAPLLSREVVTRLLRAAHPDDVTDELAELCREHGITEAHGLALGMYAALSPAARAAPLSRAGVSERAWLALRSVGERLTNLTAEAALLTREARGARRRAQVARELDRREYERLREPHEEPAFSPNPPPVPHPLELGATIDELVEEDRARRRWRLDTLQVRPAEFRRMPPSALLGESGYAAPPPVEPVIDLSDTPSMAALGRGARGPATLPPTETPFGPRRNALQRLASRLTGAERRRRRRPPPHAVARPRRQPGLSYRRQRPPFPWLLLLLLVSLVAVLILYGTNLARENAIRQADNTLQLAEQAVAAVRDAPDDATARERLALAREALAELQASGIVTATLDNRRRYDELEREYERALAAIQKLTYFEDLELVVEHPVPGGLFDSVVVPPPPAGITNTVGFTSLYLLDTNSGVLFRAPREGGRAEPILQPDSTIDLLPVGKVRAHAWRYDNIVAVAQSTEGGSFNYYFRSGNSWRFSILAGSEEWGRVAEKPFRVANYEGNLYVWGVVPSNILRYLSGQFGEFPAPWIENDGGKQFENAVDLAVDGKIYLLQPNGAVLVFSTNEATGERGFEREIPPPEVDPPLQVATRFFVSGDSPDTGFIFLVDGTNERVIQIDKVTGEFIQQIRARPNAPFDLERLSAVAVDDSLARPAVYLVNGGQVLRASLPDRPRPFRETAGPTPTPTVAP